ncbi:uncharacterized protein RJT20DRAFT_111607 [Scheffersomyces xylosifermentans]|uniref:uncharacterized protein n=1 Tax=Scheffersomyces xylosifermentans TaxID=1304137 RepID=UPI00315D0DCA
MSDFQNIVYKPNNVISNLESPENISNAMDFTNINSNDNSNDQYYPQNVSFTMPGAFRTHENVDIDGNLDANMELDESPPFTIGSEVYYDLNGEHETESLFRNNRQDSYINLSNVVNSGNSNAFNSNSGNTNNLLGTSSFSPFDNSSRVSSFHNDGLLPNSAFSAINTNDNSNSGEMNSGLSNSINGGGVIGRLRKDSVESYYSNNANSLNPHTSFASNAFSSSGIANNGNINSNNSLSPNPNINSNGTMNANINNNNSNSIFYNDLSPLTTTTSLTPSVSSVHSTQPSFFSAHQYLTRNSLDQAAPSHLVSPSYDMYAKGRPSLESQQSSSRRNQASSGRYISFTNSITNIIPFMGDRNQRSPISGPPSPQSQNSASFVPVSTPQQPSRHLIRSIFKSNNVQNNGTGSSSGNSAANNAIGNSTSMNEVDTEEVNEMNDFSGAPEDFLMMSPTKEEPEFDSIDALGASKKAKRSKRSLFTRFKTPAVKQETVEDTEMLKITNNSNNSNIDDMNTIENLDGDNSAFANGAFTAPGISRTPSTATGIVLDSASSNNSHNQSSSQQSSQILQQSQQQSQSQSQQQSQQSQQLQSQEPDYAALFENVGKRKNIVNPSSYRKPKGKVKTEEGSATVNNNSASTSSTEKSSLLNFNIGGNKNRDKTEPGNDNLETTNSAPTSERSSLFNGTLSHKSSNHRDDYSGHRDDYSDQGSRASGNNLSATSSNPSYHLHPETSENNGSTAPSTPTTSSLATASKRILGSKLMSKKSDPVGKIPVATMISKGVEVEVDLESLDLPPTTQIFPTSIINSKNRTRGRKENKQADMVDSTKIYLCNYCSRRFKRQEHLKRHFRSLHTFEKPYDCSICNKKFSRSDNLNQHLKIHKQEEEAAAAALQEEEEEDEGRMSE